MLGLSLPVGAEAAGVPPLEASAEQKQRAQELFLTGAKLYEAGELAAALAEFRSSYDVVASPNSHLMIARAMRDAGDLAGAYDELARVETEAHEMAKHDPKYAESGSKASADRAELRAKLGLVTVRVSGAGAAARVTVGGHELAWERWGEPVPIAPGAHEVIGIVGDRRVSRTIAVSAGGAVDVELELGSPTSPPLVPPPLAAPTPAPSLVAPPEPRPANPRQPSLLPYVAAAGGIGLAGVVVFVVAGAMNRSTYGGLKDACPAGVCSADPQADIDKGRSEQTVANVGLVIGLVGLGAGATLFVLDRRQGPHAGGVAAPPRKPASPDPHRAFGADGVFRSGPPAAPNPHRGFGADASLRAGPGSIVLGGSF